VHGVGEATAAITIVNALPTGIGAAVGIGLRTRVEVTLVRSGSGRRSEPTVRPADSSTPLVLVALATSVGRLAPDGVAAAGLTVRTDIPSGVGLKSSSAVTSAIVLAVANAVGRTLSPTDIARSSAEIGRATGVSATGAFDDALAGLVGGVVLTDNRQDRLLHAFGVDPGLAVALWIPPGTHPPAPDARTRFTPEPPRARAAVEAARAERPWEAMELNSALVEEAMGYSYRGLRERLRGRGAVGSGASGLGPAFAAVGPRERIGELLAELPASPGRRCSVDFSSNGAAGGLP